MKTCCGRGCGSSCVNANALDESSERYSQSIGYEFSNSGSRSNEMCEANSEPYRF